ncbi:hypothetical protein LSTR_LSTR014909 [Laodelphax striatellus]|uniref:Uncharacterized protein n=1 Tax=Laodelphax striatellus TaxID=195883 RepID=A0A482WWG7_LAOST|nr:hypothetical protein LSTR_LSTR004579 [Laodelphax striatellus]RZF37843.1 hypothetical protein LSTR_LSTR014909 [Laodelphax striatellus]
MSNFQPDSDSRELKNSERPSDILIGAEKMSRVSFGEIEPRLSKYNLLQIKPRKSQSLKHPVPNASKEAQLKSAQKECSVFNDPQVQQQLQNLILDVFGQKEDEQKTVSNNECEKYSSEFEKFTNNKRESILRFPYLVDRISIKSSTSIRQCQNDGSGSLSSNPHSRHNIESSKITGEGRQKQDNNQSQTACTNLCNDLMNTIDTHLNLASVSSHCQSQRDDCLSAERSNQRLNHNEFVNPNLNVTPSNENNYGIKTCNVREESHQKINPLQKVMQPSTDSANQSRSSASSLNRNNNKVDSCTKIDEDKKKQFLHSLFGFDKILNNQSRSNPSNLEQQKDEEYSLEQTHSTYTKLSVSNDNFHPKNNQCNCTSNNCQSKLKISEMGNLDKRTVSAERISQHDNAKRSQQQLPIFYNDFPSEGSIVNRKNSKHQLSKDRLHAKGNESQNTKQMENNYYYTDFSENCNRNEISRSFERNNEFFDFDPQLSFLLEKSSNSFPPYSNLVEQNVYFCDVSNNIPCNIQHSQPSNQDNAKVVNTEQTKLNVNNTNNSNSGMESDNKNQGTSGVYQTSKIDDEINVEIKNQMRECYDDSGCYDYNNYCNDKCCELIYNKNNRRDKNDEYTRESSPLKLSYDQQNDKMLLNSQASRKQSIDSCTCSRNSKKLSTKLLYNSSKELNKESTLRHAAYQGNSVLFDDSASNTDINRESNIKIRNYLTKCSEQTNKAMPLSQLISLDEPDYLQHLKKLRWDHIQRISREVQRLESLERFLDACGCGHIMAL